MKVEKKIYHKNTHIFSCRKGARRSCSEQGMTLRKRKRNELRWAIHHLKVKGGHSLDFRQMMKVSKGFFVNILLKFPNFFPLQ